MKERKKGTEIKYNKKKYSFPVPKIITERGDKILKIGLSD